MDVMLRIGLDELLSRHPEFPLDEADKDDLMQAWHWMGVWDEFPEALQRMKSKYTVFILSVLSFSIMVDSNKHSGITWDAIISCEFLKYYKPNLQSISKERSYWA